jgi:hypothetical protein
MGMFDHITCEHVLLGEPKPKTNFFQTKDFDCLMDHYTITEDGRLLKDGAEVQFHGSLNFYTYSDDDIWFEYEARFTGADKGHPGKGSISFKALLGHTIFGTRPRPPP